MTRTVTARIAGQTYQIPEMWLVGMARSGFSTESAVRYWHDQEMMERAAEQRAA